MNWINDMNPVTVANIRSVLELLKTAGAPYVNAMPVTFDTATIDTGARMIDVEPGYFAFWKFVPKGEDDGDFVACGETICEHDAVKFLMGSDA